MNAMLVGCIRYDHRDAQCNRERAVAVERELSSDEVEAQMSVDGSLNENLFSDHQVQDPQTDRDAMDTRADSEVSEPTMDDLNDFEHYQMENDDTT